MKIIVGHQNLDFDCVSSMVAVQKLHTDATIFLQATAEGNVLEYLNLYRHHFSFERESQFNPDDVDTVIVVDTNSRSRLGKYSEAIDQAEKVILYDHHPPEHGDIDADEVHVDSVGALITMMVEKLQKQNIKLSSVEATLFMLGLHQETGGLQFGTTGIRDYQAGTFLMEAGADLDVVQNFIYQQLTDEQMSLFNDLLSNARSLSINNVPVTISMAERDEYISEVALLAHKLRDTENANLLCLLVRLGERIQLVIRNRYSNIDAGELACQFG
ncbi:MAG: bifunctional oligoribonuclease/PAP phosphatase NrnA, partial [bacterium]